MNMSAKLGNSFLTSIEGIGAYDKAIEEETSSEV